MTKPEKPKGPAKRDPEKRTVMVSSLDQVEPSYAKEMTRPELSAALTVRKMNSPAPDDLTIDALVTELESQGKAVNDGDLKRGEQMLVAQAHTLDAIFGVCARRSQLNMGEYPQAADTYMRMALRAQSQCRATWETLAQMKNPLAVAFVRQANIAAGPQQVNNAASDGPSRPRENEFAPSRLLEADREWMDTRAAALAGRGDPALATVGEIDGTEKRGR